MQAGQRIQSQSAAYLASAKSRLVRLSVDDICKSIRAILSRSPLYPIPLSVNLPPRVLFTKLCLTFTMSFGFSVGDFIAVIELAKKIRKDFVGAPKQLKDISDEYAP